MFKISQGSSAAQILRLLQQDGRISFIEIRLRGRKQPTAALLRAAPEDKYRGILRPSAVYIHFYHFSPLPYTGSSPVAALPFSPGVARLPSHRVMTCRLSDLARGEAARFEPRNDRHRRSVEDEEKDRTEAADKRERDGDPVEVSASETARGRRTS